MNEKSHLCNFIKNHPTDWEAILTKSYKIKIKHDGPYAIFVYDTECDFADPIVQESRGIIINTETLTVACWPFRKFGNHNESYADKIDWSSARVLEKVDGSIIKLWFDTLEGIWQFSTNGTIRAERAAIDTYPGVRFGDIIKRADNFSDIPFDSLDKTKTYIFELVSPETRVVIDYGTTTLYHIGTRSNVTGVESEESIGIKKPESYPLSSLADCLKAASVLNQTEADTANEVKKEGFVVVDKSWNRVKVKSPDYLATHRITNISAISKRDCVEMLLHNGERTRRLTEASPALIPYFKYYDFKLAELSHSANKIAIIARSLYEEYSRDRAAVAKIILKHPLSGIGFLAIDRDKTRTGAEILLSLPLEKLIKLIPSYEPEDFYNLFEGNNEE